MHSGIHPTADWVYQTLRKQDPSISLGTVYRNLENGQAGARGPQRRPGGL